MGQPLPLPMKPGDLLLMHRRTMHSSLANESDDIRWSMDLRYNPIGVPTAVPPSRASWRAAACTRSAC